MGNEINGLAVMRPIVGFGLALGFAGLVFAEDGKRQIEEVVVTAEKVESTVSDLSLIHI